MKWYHLHTNHHTLDNCIVYCRKAETGVLFGNKPASSSDGDILNPKAAAEAQVLVRAAYDLSGLYFY